MFDLSNGPALRALRLKYGLTQAQLANRLGIRPATLHTWEVRPSLPDEKQTRLVAAFEAIATDLGAGWPPAKDQGELDRAFDAAVQALTAFYRVAVRHAAPPMPLSIPSVPDMPTALAAPPADSLDALLERASAPEAADTTARAGHAYVPQTGEEKARKKFEAEQEYKRLKDVTLRNSQRERDRPTIAELHAQLKPLAAAQDWDAYRRAIGQAHTRAGEDQPFMDAYCSAALARVIADEDPLVTLPLETID